MESRLPLSDTNRKMSKAFRSLCSVKILDEKALDSFLNEVSAALVEGTYDVNLVNIVRDNVKSTINFDEMEQMQVSKLEKSRMIGNAFFKELIKCRIYETRAKKEPLDPAAVELFGGMEGMQNMVNQIFKRLTENLDVPYDSTFYCCGEK